MDNASPGAAAYAPGEHARRASSFGSAADAYARHRPDYPVTAIGWALEPVTAPHARRALPSRPGRPRTVRILDLGAGTGKLTAQLAALDTPAGRPSVVAVEPDPRMLAELRRGLPGVASMAGRAEAIPLPDSSVDAVLAGQAGHWFDLDRAMPEIARVLVPGGVVAGLWNTNDDRVGWVAGLHEVCGRTSVAVFTAFSEGDADGISGWLDSATRPLFSPPERATFDHGQARTIDSLTETLGTHSTFLLMEPAEREALLGRVRHYLAVTPQTAPGEFTLPICTFVVRATRR